MANLESRERSQVRQEAPYRYPGVPTFSDIQAIATDRGDIQQSVASDPDVSDLVGMYMGEINKQNLTNEQVRVLATAIQVGKVVGALTAIAKGQDQVETDGFVSPTIASGFIEEINLGNSIFIKIGQIKRKDREGDTDSVDNGRKTVISFALKTDSVLDSDSIRKQLKSITQVFDTWQDNAIYAKHIFIERTLRYVVSRANHYAGRGLEYLDLIQEGNIGLETAVDRFDPALVDNFIPYAKLWVNQAIFRGLANKSMAIRLPEHMFRLVIKLRNVSGKLAVSLGRIPTEKELARGMGMSVEEVRGIVKNGALNSGPSYDVLSGQVGQGEGEFYYEKAGQDSSEVAGEKSDERRIVLEAVEELDEPYRTVIIMNYGLDGKPKTLEEIGELLGIGRNKMGTMAREARGKLKELLQGVLGDEEDSLSEAVA